MRTADPPSETAGTVRANVRPVLKEIEPGIFEVIGRVPRGAILVFEPVPHYAWPIPLVGFDTGPEPIESTRRSSAVRAMAQAEGRNFGDSDNANRWLTASEAARYLCLPSRKALYQAVRRGEFPVHRQRGGRRQRFDRDELDRVLTGKSTK